MRKAAAQKIITQEEEDIFIKLIKNYREKVRRDQIKQNVQQDVRQGSWDEWVLRRLKDKWSRYPESNPLKNPERGLTLEYIKSIWPKDNICPILKEPFILSTTATPDPYSPSIDRIIPGKGYVKGNIFIISVRANTIKNYGTVGEIKAIADWLKEQESKINRLTENTIVNGVELDDKTINFINNILAARIGRGWDLSNHPIRTADTYSPEQLQGFKDKIMPRFGNLSVLNTDQKKIINDTIGRIDPERQKLQKLSALNYAQKTLKAMKEEYARGNPELYIRKRLLPKSKIRAKKRGIYHAVTVKDILEVWPKNFMCPALKIPLVLNEETMPDSPSLDRINSNYGYIKNNIAIISYKANVIKNDATSKELYEIVNFMSSHGIK